MRIAAILGMLSVLALLYAPWMRHDPTGPGAPTMHAATGTPQDAHLVPGETGPRAHASTADASPTREAVATADAEPAPLEWTVQLTGLDPSIPWTAPLRLVFEERLPVHGQVDHEGTWRFSPPTFARLPGVQHMRLVADDDHYRLDQPRQRTDGLQTTGRAEFAVFPIGLLRGRVLGPDGKGAAALVSAFAWQGNAPTRPLVGRVETGPDGDYVLRVPPTVPLLLVAEALLGSNSQPWSIAPLPPRTFDLGESASLSDLSLPDRNERRDDLVPAAARSEAARNGARTVPDLHLGAAAVLQGRAMLADGQPLTEVDVVAVPAAPTTTGWHRDLHWSTTEGLLPGARARTDARGVFALRLPAGVAFTVMATTQTPLLLAGEPQATASAPGFVELVAPGDVVRLRALANGEPVPHAWIDVDALTRRTGDTGTLRVTLGPQPVRVRARDHTRCSPWLELPPGSRPALAALELQASELAEVRLQLRSTPELGIAHFDWQPLPAGPMQTCIVTRDRSAKEFVVRVPAGRGRLTVREVDGLGGGAFLVPVSLELDVPPAGLPASCDAVFGGQLRLDVRDANGLRPAGTFTLRDTQGRNVAVSTITYDQGDARVAEPGVLQPGGINHVSSILMPGDYTLDVVTTHGRAQRTITIRAQEQTQVSLSLP